ncbi:MAG: isochorismate synthase [Patulibacter sp.]|nr:isochorismate synthase [Patulibacter sp.]
MTSTATLTSDRPAEGDLLAHYQPGSSSFFASPGGTALLGEGVAAVLPAWATDDSRADRVAGLLDDARRSGHPDPVAIGALPFDEDLPARIVVPARTRRGRTADLIAPPAPVLAGDVRTDAASGGPADPRAPRLGTHLRPVDDDGQATAAFSLEPVTAHDVFVRSVERAIEELQRGDLRKVVLSRALQLTAAAEVDPAVLLARLLAGEPSAYAFAIDLSRAMGRARDGYPARATRTLVGASPELLLRRRGARVLTNPLAGSLPRHPDPTEDARRAAALQASAKDLGEHAVVVEAIGDALAPLCAELTLPARPTLVRTSTMWHLGTEISGSLRDPDLTSLHVALALHPTPAICGTPSDAARAAIGRLEPYDRDFYTGLVGWTDAAGDGDWAVTIRCAQVEGRDVRVYAGAGIMADSDPQAELAETAAKAGTLLRAMGIDAEPEFAR